jgi:hypothetical protein
MAHSLISNKIQMWEKYFRKPSTNAFLLITALLLFMGFFRLHSVPAPWWDEGWTMDLARNWVQHDHYGRYLKGEPTAAAFSAHFPVVSQVALSFRILGVGIWQARLPGVLLSLGAIALIYYLALRLYNRTIAWGTLLAVLFLLTLPEINPILNGRQVLGDMPLAFYLLAGYVSFLAAWRKPVVFLPLTILFWGIALNIKAQTFPFWLLALLLPLLVAFLKRSWYSCILLILALLGSWVTSQWLISLQNYIVGGISMPREPLEGLFQSLAFVTALSARVSSIAVLFHSGLPTLLALVYVSRGFIKDFRNADFSNPSEVIKFSLLVFSGSWFAWFMLLSTGGPRYMVTPGFMTSIFVALLLYEYSNKFNLKLTILRAAQFLKLKRLDISGLKSFIAVIITGPMVLITIITSYSLLLESDNSLTRAVQFLNSQTHPGAIIETCDPELFLSLERPYHFPPDQVQLDFFKRWTQDPGLEIDYDPLISDPDYLVVGPAGASWNVYDEVILAGEFELVKQFPRYVIYQRVR